MRRFAIDTSSAQLPISVELCLMEGAARVFGEMDDKESVERLLGDELLDAVEKWLARPTPDLTDPALCPQVATVQILLALYWELRHQRLDPSIPDDLDSFSAGASPTDHDPSPEQLAALLRSLLSLPPPPDTA